VMNEGGSIGASSAPNSSSPASDEGGRAGPQDPPGVDDEQRTGPVRGADGGDVGGAERPGVRAAT